MMTMRKTGTGSQGLTGGGDRERRERARATYRMDLVRGGAQGVLEACWYTFSLVVLIRVFSADESVKRYVPAAYGFGLMLAPFTLAWLGRKRWLASSYVSVVWLCIAVAFVVAAVVPHMYAVLVGMIAGQLLSAQAVPVFTHFYNENYPRGERGQRLSSAVLLTSLFLIGFGLVGGPLLDRSLQVYPLIFGAGAVAAMIGAVAVSRIPASSLSVMSSGRLYENLKVAWNDRVFLWMLAGWMLLGLGNLMLLPLRVELLANPRFGIDATNTQIALLMVVIVPVFRLLSTKGWGYVFDRFNLIWVRIALNGVFIVSMYLFFFSESLVVMAVGAAALGIAFGGGNVMWVLWVTKIAPPGRTPIYMSVHGFSTGIRISAAPFLGYGVLEVAGPRSAAILAMGLMFVSCLIFLPLKPVLERYRRGEIATG